MLVNNSIPLSPPAGRRRTQRSRRRDYRRRHQRRKRMGHRRRHFSRPKIKIKIIIKKINRTIITVLHVKKGILH